jgi:hypothetical protein
VWAEPPSYDYLCDESFCIPSPSFPNVTWPQGQTSFYQITDGYFNLPPPAFGLDYGIFAEEVINGVTTGDWSSQTSLTHFPPSPTGLRKVRDLPPQARALGVQKRDNTVVPAVCYAVCNNCYVEAQSVGKSPALCASGSAFESDLNACNGCVAANGDSSKVTLQTYVDPEFEPFISFCSAQSAQPELGASTSTSTATVVPVPATQNGERLLAPFCPSILIHFSFSTSLLNLHKDETNVPSVVVAGTTTTAPTPTVSVAITSQAPPASNNSPVPVSPQTPAPSTTKTAGGAATSGTSGTGGTGVTGGGSATTSAPAQVTTNSSNTLRPSSLAVTAFIAVFAVFAFFL